MALNAYLTLKGQKQGNINGSVTQKGRENSILVHAYSNQIVAPRDPASGLPTGKRQHTPVVIVKEVDRASPLLWSALVNNENLLTWELKFWTDAITPGSSSPETQMYTVRLTNASIASIRESMPDNEDAANQKLPLRQEVTFTYQKIEWVWNDGGITSGDSWEGAAA